MVEATLFEGGTLVDGSGAAARRGSLLISGDRIVSIDFAAESGLPPGIAAANVNRIDCRGLVVAPGFIDVHTHDDAAVLRDPAMLCKVSQGVTSVVTGNCGLSLAPYRTAQAGGSLALLGADEFRFASQAEYRDAVAAACPAVNVAPLVGHTTLRCATMPDLGRAADAAERAAMARLLEAAMDEGALGLSSGLFYDEAHAAPAAEVTELARVVARHGGIYATHLRSEMETILEAMLEAADCAFDAGVPLLLSHHKCAGPAQWGRTRQTLALVEQFAQRQPVALDAYPYTAGSTVLREDLVDGEIDVLVTWSDTHPEMTGRLLADIALEWGTDQVGACQRLKPGGACYFQMHEDDVQRVLAHPRTMIGSDGLPRDRHPHPRLWGTFPRTLGRYWRELGLLSLEQAVHKMTGLAARNFRLPGRGQLREGAHADIVVFDSARIADSATYAEPCALSAGVVAVYVNGVFSYGEGGASVGRAGRVLTRSG